MDIDTRILLLNAERRELIERLIKNENRMVDIELESRGDQEK